MLRALEPEDLELLYRIENDMQFWCYGDTTSPYSRFQLRQYIASASGDAFRDGQVRFAIDERGTTVGYVDLQDLSALHARAAVGIVVLPEHQRRGYATQALLHVAQYARDVLHLHQLYATVASTNAASLALFAKAGYKKTATLSEWLSTPTGWADMSVVSLRL